MLYFFSFIYNFKSVCSVEVNTLRRWGRTFLRWTFTVGYGSG